MSVGSLLNWLPVLSNGSFLLPLFGCLVSDHRIWFLPDIIKILIICVISPLYHLCESQIICIGDPSLLNRFDRYFSYQILTLIVTWGTIDRHPMFLIKVIWHLIISVLGYVCFFVKPELTERFIDIMIVVVCILTCGLTLVSCPWALIRKDNLVFTIVWACVGLYFKSTQDLDYDLRHSYWHISMGLTLWLGTHLINLLPI